MRPLISSGTDLSPYPPKEKIETCTVTRLGCQKKGKKSETYTVHFQDSLDSSKTYTCAFAHDVWKMYKENSQYDAEVRLLGGLDCASIKLKE